MNEAQGDSVMAYVAASNVATLLCRKCKIVYMNKLAKKLIKTEISLPCSVKKYERACGFKKAIILENNEDKTIPDNELWYKTENDKEKQYEKYKYTINESEKEFLCYYKEAASDNIIPPLPWVKMEDICMAQELKRAHDIMCAQVNLLVHDIRTAVNITSLNMQVLSEYVCINGDLSLIRSQQQFEEALNKVNEYIKSALEGCYIQGEYALLLSQIMNKVQGNTSVIQTKYDIVESLNNLIQFFKHFAATSGVTICWQGDTVPCIVNSDKLKISEAVSNIIINAIKYTGCKESEEKKVTVSVRSTKGNVNIIIKDTGIGINEEDIEHLNEKYFRASIAKEIEPYGKGLGLYLAHNAITLLGGEIKCKSKLGKGSTFEIKIPRGNI